MGKKGKRKLRGENSSYLIAALFQWRKERRFSEREKKAVRGSFYTSLFRREVGGGKSY